MRTTITNLQTKETIELGDRLSFATQGFKSAIPDWVFEQLDCHDIGDIMHYLDNINGADFYDDNGNHKGPDVLGVSLFLDERVIRFNALVECKILDGISENQQISRRISEINTKAPPQTRIIGFSTATII